MKFRKYIFAIVFMKNENPKFLIFHRIKNWKGWEFLKGGLKENESEAECLKREIAEETGAKKYKIFARTGYLIKYSGKRNM
jgi:8-oxo-dGTP pyrophosphatase MutT (NUDIX family)